MATRKKAITSWTQFFPTRPKAKGRPRMTRTGRAYTPKATLDFEREIAALYEGPNFGSVAVKVDLAFTKAGIQLTVTPLSKDNYSAKGGYLTGDIDNYSKAVLDALNGLAYADDEQIVDLHSSKGWQEE